jgi:Protein of unknown function (DUF416)
MLRYDEQSLVDGLSRLPLASRVMFAAACAERLRPLFRRYHEVSGEANLEQLDAALEAAWGAALGAIPRDGLSAWQTVAEGLVPNEDDESWVDEYAYGQNGAAAVAYALRTALTGEPQEAAWGARQVYEAADFAAQRQLPDLDQNRTDAEGELLSTPVVQEALAGMRDDLSALQPGDLPLERVLAVARERARQGGLRLAQLA